ncbi:haloacid dehalogenase type II [Roseomonas sp. SSH11]|uniref:(S)-2-haloacid dehalogenase n=1 Tax=Pararoseomonas baculiformis TaxID=2820812 RepID=A0ABS4AHE9_9PROT|nr:haloacid dehalogenase type II [Pararoseomonas baculiformis]MBP0446299.1 haloacid dehalogenase type II [Pararoseomonas baculiformis]
MLGLGGPERPEVVAFDIIETVFPLEPLRPVITELGLPPAGLEGWFAAGLRDAFALSATGDFRPFPEVLRAALDQVLAEQGLAPPEEARALLAARMKALPARQDAREAFGMIARAGMRIMALSNGAAASTRGLLEQAGLEDLVEHVVSVEEVGTFKPRREVYEHAARIAQAEPGRMALVAVHPWDIQGAKAAGMTTAYVSVERPFPPVMRKPDLEAPSLSGAAEALVAL